MSRITNIKLRRGTSASWSSANPVLDAGEVGWDSTVGKFKIGDASTTWNSLAYAGDAGLALKVNNSSVGAANGVAGLGSDGKVPPGQLPLATVAWSTGIAYAAGQMIVSPAGDIVTAFEAHTSPATYNPAQWYSDNFGYLFANFTYNSWEGEKLNVFYSPDGVTVTGHGPNPLFAPATGLRDPSISKIGNKWFMAYGFHDPTVKQFAVASSPDLINWTTIATLNVSAIPNITQAWAPELYVNPENNNVYIFFTSVEASDMEVWYIQATDGTLATWGSATQLSWTSAPSKAMDPVFTKSGSTWYMFYGDNNYICRATATSLLGPWTTDKTGDWAGWGINKEAPSIMRLGPSKWRLYIDRYTGTGPNWSYPGYAYTESTDLVNWSTLTALTMGPDNKNNIVLRHGSFIKIQDQATAAVVKGVMLSGASTIRHAEYTSSTSVPSGSETQVGTLTLNTGRSFNTSDFALPAAGQIKIGTTGKYSITVHAGVGANNFGNGASAQWVTVYSTTISGNVIRNVSVGGYELSASDGGLYFNAGDIIEIRLAQFSGSTKTIDSAIRISKIS
jgi:hypothetical protein